MTSPSPNLDGMEDTGTSSPKLSRKDYKEAYELLDQRLLKGEITDEQYRLWKKKLAAEEPHNPWFWVIGAVVVILILGTLTMCNSILNSPTKTGTTAAAESPQHIAMIACRNAVKAQLKSPSSAQFSGETVEAAGSIWKVKGNVDADNSYGAAMRLTYQCNVDGSSAVVTYLTQ